MFPVHGKNGMGWPQMGPGGFLFLLIQALPTFWAERIWILRIFTFFIFRIPNFWISRFPDFQNLAWAGPWAQLSLLSSSSSDSQLTLFCWTLSTMQNKSGLHHLCGTEAKSMKIEHKGQRETLGAKFRPIIINMCDHPRGAVWPRYRRFNRTPG